MWTTITLWLNVVFAISLIGFKLYYFKKLDTADKVRAVISIMVALYVIGLMILFAVGYVKEDEIYMHIGPNLIRPALTVFLGLLLSDSIIVYKENQHGKH